MGFTKGKSLDISLDMDETPTWNIVGLLTIIGMCWFLLFIGWLMISTEPTHTTIEIDPEHYAALERLVRSANK